MTRLGLRFDCGDDNCTSRAGSVPVLLAQAHGMGNQYVTILHRRNNTRLPAKRLAVHDFENARQSGPDMSLHPSPFAALHCSYHVTVSNVVNSNKP